MTRETMLAMYREELETLRAAYNQGERHAENLEESLNELLRKIELHGQNQDARLSRLEYLAGEIEQLEAEEPTPEGPKGGPALQIDGNVARDTWNGKTYHIMAI